MTTTPPRDLGAFDGQQVLGTTIAVTNAGDGLSKAMRVDPQLLHLDQTVYVVLECTVGSIKFSPAGPDVSGVVRVHTLRAGAATLVDKDLVDQHLRDQERRIEEAAGVQRLPGDIGDAGPVVKKGGRKKGAAAADADGDLAAEVQSIADRRAQREAEAAAAGEADHG